MIDAKFGCITAVCNPIRQGAKFSPCATVCTNKPVWKASGKEGRPLPPPSILILLAETKSNAQKYHRPLLMTTILVRSHTRARHITYKKGVGLNTKSSEIPYQARRCPRYLWANLPTHQKWYSSGTLSCLGSMAPPRVECRKVEPCLGYCKQLQYSQLPANFAHDSGTDLSLAVYGPHRLETWSFMLSDDVITLPWLWESRILHVFFQHISAQHPTGDLLYEEFEDIGKGLLEASTRLYLNVGTRMFKPNACPLTPVSQAQPLERVSISRAPYAVFPFWLIHAHWTGHCSGHNIFNST